MASVNRFSMYAIFPCRQHDLISHLQVAGYDASNELYKAFLSQEMQYSCPIWGDEEGGVRGDLTGQRTYGDLERAQERKIGHILKKARLQPGHRLLEIGSGWGSLAIAAAEMGCTVDSLTLSVEQKTLAEERIKKAGFESQIRIHLMDYRNMLPSARVHHVSPSLVPTTRYIRLVS
ncbi:Mycolic acid cyclopropane synthetase-domain-containing protein [Armillaria borealis]|uniref:Mycolic acid cyclopropane synthetase-domain-containing protein n=1 Tax=Armillaria borealis TaxID=47425 RepID=A0AA39JKC0_9AGAR|nr:Mycolic acid cyclopropane synthetase-domain-containing protein [Armillaria borealis]